MVRCAPSSTSQGVARPWQVPPRQPGAGWLAGVAARRVATHKALTAGILVTLLVSNDVAPI